jgi:hypothetical protein
MIETIWRFKGSGQLARSRIPKLGGFVSIRCECYFATATAHGAFAQAGVKCEVRSDLRKFAWLFERAKEQFWKRTELGFKLARKFEHLPTQG